jgi:hypothetical protein
MPPRGPFKKDLTPIGRGGVNKFTGKGAREQSRGGLGGAESLTGGSRLGSMANHYPKPSLEDLAPDSAAPPVPMGASPPKFPTAMMPGGSGDSDGDEAA